MDIIDTLIQESPTICLILTFVLGAVIGSFLNVCIARMPLQKSILWPGSRCGNCLQPVKWHDNIPLVSYWLLGGRCRSCGTSFSSRYFWIELLTALVFAGLFWLEVIENVRHVGVLPFDRAVPVSQSALLGIWVYHAIFLSLLVVATFTDFDYKEIPLGITIPGTILGVIGGTLGPWPWPMQAEAIRQVFPAWQAMDFNGMDTGRVFMLPVGLYHWPFWMPTWSWLPPGSWQMGLVTSLAGVLLGTLMVRGVSFLFGKLALGKEGMGLGDADLMMMIGAFLGWQSLFLVLMFAVFLGLGYALVLVIRGGGHELPFGPFLAGGAVAMLFSWHIWTASQWLFFNGQVLLALAFLFFVVGFFLILAIRMMRLIVQAT